MYEAQKGYSMQTHRKIFLIAAMLVLAACGQGKWHTHDAWARPTTAGGNAAVYFLLHNATSHDDALLSASSDVATAVEIHHSHLIGETEGEGHDHAGEEPTGEAHPISELEAQDLADVGSMEPVDRVDIAAGHEIEFQPGGYHIMLIGLTKELKAGDHFVVTLHFENSEDLQIEVQVLAP